MARELELKAAVSDPARVRQVLLGAGASLQFEGEMSDRRFDRGDELTARDQILRVRSYHHADGRTEWVVAWKGPAHLSGGYKAREELELSIVSGRDPPEALLRALGYEVIHAIDRQVAIYRLQAATLRLETYPRMDSLLEVEGEPVAIERAIEATGIPRWEFTAEPLAGFVLRFESRTGQRAVLARHPTPVPSHSPPDVLGG
jgi:adenylate cyclase class IV